MPGLKRKNRSPLNRPGPLDSRCRMKQKSPRPPISTSRHGSRSWSRLATRNASINTGRLPKSRWLSPLNSQTQSSNMRAKSKSYPLPLQELSRKLSSDELKMCGETSMQGIYKMLVRGLLAAWIAFGATDLAPAEVGRTRPVKQAEDGTIKLDAAEANIQGPNARVEGGDPKDVMWW